MDPDVAVGGGLAVFGGLFMLFWLAVVVVMIAAVWKVFAKAGQPGWAAIVPIYNVIVLMKIVGRPTWWVVLFFIPLVNFVVAILVCMDLAKSFGQGAGFGIGLLLLAPIFYLILGFGGARYVGPAAAQPGHAPAPA
ncbi:MAG: hypothetical protein KJZ84_15110 [Bryobacteraceae bacterium]|nr:hypothetical protein [Bryobacteraceae bacterium]